MYEDTIKEFEDKINLEDCFNSYSFKTAHSKILNSKSNLIFLIGVAGSGKTFLIDFLKNEIDFIFLQGLITKEDIDKAIEENKLIVIDEAQLLDISLIEYIRILSDTKKHRFLLSMHLLEAKDILEKEHFKSRSIDIIELKPISKEEMVQYLNIKLIKSNANHLFTKKEFNRIYQYTQGNFRYIKKFVKTLFELLEIAHQNNLVKYNKINSCLITMSAIHLGLENG